MRAPIERFLYTESALDTPSDRALTEPSPAKAARMLVAERARILPLWLRTKGIMMPEYRLYFVGPDDYFHGPKTVECADDDRAFVCALDNIGDFPAVEVWRGIKRLAESDGSVSSGA